MKVSLEKASSESYTEHMEIQTHKKRAQLYFSGAEAGAGGSILHAKLHVGIIPLYQRET